MAYRFTRKQVEAVKRLYDRDPDGSPSYLQFRRRVWRHSLGSDKYVALQWCNMFVGIETDGYTHT